MMPISAMVLSDVKFAWPWLLAVAALVPWLLILLHRWSEKRARRNSHKSPDGTEGAC